MNFLDGLKKLLGAVPGAAMEAGKAVAKAAPLLVGPGPAIAPLLKKKQQQAQPMPPQPARPMSENKRRSYLNEAIGMPYGDYTTQMPQSRPAFGAYDPRQQGAPFIPRPAEDDAMVWGPRGAQPLNTIQRNQPWQRMNDQPFDPYEYY